MRVAASSSRSRDQTEKPLAFYRLSGRFLSPDGGTAGNLLTEIGIEFQGFQDSAGHTIINLTGMLQVHRIANHHLKRSLCEMEPAFRGKGRDGGVQRAFHVAPLRFHPVAILRKYFVYRFHHALLNLAIVALGIQHESDLMP